MERRLLGRDGSHFPQDLFEGVWVVRLTEGNKISALGWIAETALTQTVQMSLSAPMAATVLMIEIAPNYETCCVCLSLLVLLNHSGFHLHDGDLYDKYLQTNL